MKSKSIILFGLLFMGALLLPLLAIAAEPELILRNNLKQALPGDYIIVAQNKNYTALIIRSKEADNLSIEEITVPSSRICNEKSFSWRQWILAGAVGNTSWIMYNINLVSGNIQQAFSFSRNEWITVPQSQNFLSTLLNLQLKGIPERERKKLAHVLPKTALIGAPSGSQTLSLKEKLFQGCALMLGEQNGQKMAPSSQEKPSRSTFHMRMANILPIFLTGCKSAA